jgi:phosphomevalonate kinase
MVATVVSAPGKVLLAGGYLVLDPSYSGVVISTSSRFYTSIETWSTPFEIEVYSPQFISAKWRYRVEKRDGGKIRVDQIGQADELLSTNKFVHLGLHHTLSLLVEMKGVKHLSDILSQSGLRIVIVGGNDFYSQRTQLSTLNLPLTLASLSRIPPFAPTGVTIQNVHKTGLGSSAALITSLVSCLLVHFSVIEKAAFRGDDMNEGRQLAHNTSQFIHCLAQGKVGSGFDVSAAVFGSQIYTRFHPQVIQGLMDDKGETDSLLPILRPSNSDWNQEVRTFQLAPGMRLMLADVAAGSDTPSLVGKVLKWRQQNREKADLLWKTLSHLNMKFAKTILRLSELHVQYRSEYADALAKCASRPSTQWPLHSNEDDESVKEIVETFSDLHQVSEQIRSRVREMGTEADVPIEPEPQTDLIDQCIAQAGVIAGGVPGAGGYDALWLLVVDAGDVINRIEGIWQRYTRMNVSPLMANESREKGVRVEDANAIEGLAETIASM